MEELDEEFKMAHTAALAVFTNSILKLEKTGNHPLIWFSKVQYSRLQTASSIEEIYTIIDELQKMLKGKEGEFYALTEMLASYDSLFQKRLTPVTEYCKIDPILYKPLDEIWLIHAN